MMGLGEHVEGEDFTGVIPLRLKDGEVSHQGSGIAGDVNHLAGTGGADHPDQIFAEPFAGRIGDDHICRMPFLLQAAESRTGIFAKKAGVGDGVVRHVLLRSGDRGSYGIDAGNRLHQRGYREGDGTHPAIEIQHPIRLAETGDLLQTVQQLDHLHRVNLEEGVGIDPELLFSQLFFDVRLAPNHNISCSQNQVGALGIEIQLHTVQIGKMVFQFAEQDLPFRNFAGGYHQHHHELMGKDAAPHHHMAQKALMGLLIVDRDMVLVGPIAHQMQHPVGVAGLHQALIDGTELMTAALKQAEHRLSGTLLERQLGFVAVIEGFGHAFRRVHRDPTQAGIAL